MAINEKQIQDNISKQVQNQIAQQKQSINNSLGIQKKEYDETINRNKSYLTEQIGQLNTQRVVNDDRTTALQNRRGGFYSGGLDYQLAENLRNTQNAQSSITRDINDKNMAIQGQYDTLARQAAENIRMLEMQAPDLIRQMVLEEMDRQQQLRMQEEQWALEKQLKQLQLQNARSRGSGGGSRRSSGGSSRSTSSKSTPVAQQFRADAKQSQKTSQDRYYESKMKQLNEGRSLARKPIQDLYPGLVPNYRNDMSIPYYERNKILLDSLRGR